RTTVADALVAPGRRRVEITQCMPAAWPERRPGETRICSGRLRLRGGAAVWKPEPGPCPETGAQRHQTAHRVRYRGVPVVEGAGEHGPRDARERSHALCHTEGESLLAGGREVRHQAEQRRPRQTGADA